MTPINHDPDRFYHCDCIEGGYLPPCDECAAIRAQLDASRAEVARLRRVLEGARKDMLEADLDISQVDAALATPTEEPK